MNKSDSIKELAAALAMAQGDIEKADKDKDNPHFRSKYADLGNVIDAIKPALVKNNLTFTQLCHECTNAAMVETIIMHQSGEWISCGCISVPVSKNDAQGYGSALTYARRYSLSAAFGVAPEDDDGNAAAKAAPKPAAKPAPTPVAKPKTISSEQNRLLRTLLTKHAVSPDTFKQHFGIESSLDLLTEKMDEAVKWIEGQRAEV